MKTLTALLLILVSLTARADDLGLVRSVDTDGRRVLMQVEAGVISFDPALQFEAAVEEIAAVLSEQASSVRVLEDVTVHMSWNQFQKLAHLWPEMSLKAAWSSRLSLVQAEGASVKLKILKGLLRRGPTPTLTSGEKIWLGCDDSVEHCLGMTATISNPNLLTPMPTLEESRLLQALSSTENLQRTARLTLPELTSAFERARIPSEMARWMALKLLSRRQSVLDRSSPNLHLAALMAMGPGYRRGQLIQVPSGFEADLTLEHLEARVQGFLMSRLDEVQKLAEFVLSNFPYMTIEPGKSFGHWSLAPGFMIRVKRRIEKNLHAKNASEQYRVEDSLEVFASVSFGPHAERGFFSLSAGVGPAYVRRYSRVHLAATEEQARTGYWRISKDLLTGRNLEDLLPRERLTVQSGFLANASFNGNLRVLGQSRVRPQAWIMGNHQWLTLSHVYRAQDGDLFLGRGSSQGFEVSAQAFWRVISKIARIPVLNFRRSWMEATNDVYKVSSDSLHSSSELSVKIREAIQGSSLPLPKEVPVVHADADYKMADFWLDWGFGNRDERRWSGHLTATVPREGATWLQADQNFLLFEKTETDHTRWSLSRKPKFERCSYWAALALKNQKKPEQLTANDLLESGLKISCALRFEGSQTFDETQAQRLMRKLQLPEMIRPQLWDSKIARLTTDLQWSLTVSPEDLEPLFAAKPTGWIQNFAREIEAQRHRKQDEPFEVSQERLLLRTVMTTLFSIREPAKRLEFFFDWLSESGARDLFLEAFLKRSSNHQIEVKRWTAGHDDRRLVFQEFKLGEVPATSMFELLEERDKWFGH